jgi:hypothetical protein
MLLPWVLALFGDPLAVLVLLVLVLDGTSGYPVGAALLPVLLFGRVEGFLVDLLRVFGQIVLHAIRQFVDLPVRHVS